MPRLGREGLWARLRNFNLIPRVKRNHPSGVESGCSLIGGEWFEGGPERSGKGNGAKGVGCAVGKDRALSRSV